MEDEMLELHHQFNGHEFEQTLGDSEGQGNHGTLPYLKRLRRPEHCIILQVPDGTVDQEHRVKNR